MGIAIKIHHNTEAFEFGVHTAISLGSVALWHLGLFSFLRLKYSSVICSPDKSELKTQLNKITSTFLIVLDSFGMLEVQ